MDRAQRPTRHDAAKRCRETAPAPQGLLLIRRRDEFDIAVKARFQVGTARVVDQHHALVYASFRQRRRGGPEEAEDRIVQSPHEVHDGAPVRAGLRLQLRSHVHAIPFHREHKAPP
ncbi:hypothetical protein [Piscinibacter sp.]|uniref:hypothetical protein n=1 Tax=Piscinibacter sp. TaxID=1903157 RepID=UPI002F42873D